MFSCDLATKVATSWVKIHGPWGQFCSDLCVDDTCTNAAVQYSYRYACWSCLFSCDRATKVTRLIVKFLRHLRNILQWPLQLWNAYKCNYSLQIGDPDTKVTTLLVNFSRVLSKFFQWVYIYVTFKNETAHGI